MSPGRHLFAQLRPHIRALSPGRQLRNPGDAGAVTVGITSYLRSPFTELCQQAIIAGATERHGLEATASRLVHLTVVDLLVALLADLDPTTTTRAQQLYTDAVAAHRV